MTKQELEILTNSPVSSDDYDAINHVYTFHPSISETAGKQQIADLYKTFGMRIIMDMFPTACEAQKLEEGIRAKQLELESLKEAFSVLKRACN